MTGEADARAPAAVLGAADELAAAGVLSRPCMSCCCKAWRIFAQRLDEQFADSLTSREILYSTKLPEAGRSSLRDIVNRVEWTYFGERPAAPADYDACRASFNALAQALHGNALHGSAPRKHGMTRTGLFAPPAGRLDRRRGRDFRDIALFHGRRAR